MKTTYILRLCGGPVWKTRQLGKASVPARQPWSTELCSSKRLNFVTPKAEGNDSNTPSVPCGTVADTHTLYRCVGRVTVRSSMLCFRDRAYPWSDELRKTKNGTKMYRGTLKTIGARPAQEALSMTMMGLAPGRAGAGRKAPTQYRHPCDSSRKVGAKMRQNSEDAVPQ